MRSLINVLAGSTLALVLAAPLAASAQPGEEAAETAAEHMPAPEGGHGGAEQGHGGGHHKAEPPPPINWYEPHYGKDLHGGALSAAEEPMPPGLLFALFNFAVFVGLLVKFAGPKLMGYLRSRHETVKTALEEAAALRAEARAKLDEYNRRIAGIDEEVAKLMQDIRSDAEAERDHILAQARTQAESMKREAQSRIESEIARARLALEREVVSAAVAAAQTVLAQRTTPEDQSRLFDGFIANLVASGTGGPAGGGNGGAGGGPTGGKRTRRGTVDEEWGK
jgi:F-type H+-transporting ATPase subunit b